eukprot:766343-Hanusia_phi.AAC.3
MMKELRRVTFRTSFYSPASRPHSRPVHLIPLVLPSGSSACYHTPAAHYCVEGSVSEVRQMPD